VVARGGIEPPTQGFSEPLLTKTLVLKRLFNKMCYVRHTVLSHSALHKAFRREIVPSKILAVKGG